MSLLLSAAAAQLGDAALTESGLIKHIHPLFSKILARDSREIYLANHSLGRPLDALAADVAEGLAAWYEDVDSAWGPWWGEMQAWRANTAGLLSAAQPGMGRTDCIIPKTSAGQGLRAVLNSYELVPTVLATDAEFDSIDHILKQYAAKGRANVRWVASRDDGLIHVEDMIAGLAEVDLLVVSHIFFATGQILEGLPTLIAAAHAAGTRVLLDVYHSYGVLPLDLIALGVDYAIAGSYKYLRGGPGVCWLYIAPHLLDHRHTTLDTGWFAKRDPFAYQRPVPPQFADGGDAWLESTFNPLGFYQARSGLALIAALGVDRLRAYSLRQKQLLAENLADQGVASFGASVHYGAFITLPHAEPKRLAEQLKQMGINGDARAAGLRLCPDLLNTDAQLCRAAAAIAQAMRAPA
ncbi:aminotransferase class V-fold PLP-dependent enzyme [Chitinimonas sp. BJB300]|uniref:aminotransferase class V-fold PLP-dependent enzyme n=1 Tax=Chitinimonas sp. BJB300 TaxID=1559339 RepID=UPI000C0DCD56|nr:aminotransferase class V-fold PLP-dependent enzyme [Chitinimonas sp. BJB300]PHV10729.1 aminotransferase [Chitinimonas sp. BJB300]TSJ88550.1 aminotransferase class V-fold PLP-dependent enzyme [Chitinimonas sp. BJB300]